MLAIGRLIEQKDHATLLRRVRARARDAPRRAARDPRLGAARRGRRRALAQRLGLDDAVLVPGPGRAARLARARGRLRAHLALGGLRDRAARGDARRRCPSSRRASARSRRSSSTARPGCSPRPATPTALADALSTLLADARSAARARRRPGSARAHERVLGRAHDRADDRRLRASRRVREVSPARARARAGPDAGPRRAALDLVPRPQQPALRRAAAAPRAPRRVPAAPARRARSRAALGFRALRRRRSRSCYRALLGARRAALPRTCSRSTSSSSPAGRAPP